MPCKAITNKRGKLSISRFPVPCELTLNELAMLDYVVVPGVGSIGDTGIEQEISSYSTTNAGLSPQSKGAAVGKAWDVEMLESQSEARDILEAASAAGNKDTYATRIEWTDGVVEFSIVQVSSPTYVKGAPSGVRIVRYTMVPSFVPIVTNSLPVASNVVISGDGWLGSTLVATYDYYSPLGLPEDGSAYQWYVSGSPSGAGATPIPGATGQSLTVDDMEYLDQYLVFGVTPSDGMKYGPEVRVVAGPVDINLVVLFQDDEYGFLNQLGIDTLFTDTSGTTPVEEYGDAIALAVNLADDGPDMVQATGAERLVWGRAPVVGGVISVRNELVGSDALSTQDVTVTAAQRTLSFRGTGTVTLTGASTAGPLEGTGEDDIVSLTFTPTAGSLTLTVSGDVLDAQLELGASRSNYQSVGAGRYDIAEPGTPSVNIAYSDTSDDNWSWNLAAGTYSLFIAGEKGCYFDTVTHAGGEFTVGPTTWTGGPADAVTDLIGQRYVLLPVVLDRAFSDFEKAQLVAYAMAKGCPGVWNAGSELVTNGTFDSNIDGWAQATGQVSGTVTWESGAMRVARDVGSPNSATQPVTLGVGALFLVEAEAEFVSGTGNPFAICRDGTGVISPTVSTSANIPATTSGVIYGIITSSAASGYLHLGIGASPATYDFDNVSLKKLTLNTDPLA